MKPGDLVEFDPYGIQLDVSGRILWNREEEQRYGILLYKTAWGDWAILRGDMILHCPLHSFKLLDKIG